MLIDAAMGWVGMKLPEREAAREDLRRRFGIGPVLCRSGAGNGTLIPRHGDLCALRLSGSRRSRANSCSIVDGDPPASAVVG